MEIYLSGCFVSFFLGCITLIFYIYKAIFGRTRIQTENYYKVLMFYKFSDGKFVKGEQNFIRGFLSTVFSQLVINPLLSWLSVILRVIGLFALIRLKRKVKEVYSKETLDKVEELKLKIKYTQLSKSEMEESLTKIDELLGTNDFIKDNGVGSENEQYEDNEYIITRPYDWTDSFIVEGNKLYVHSHPDDYLSDFHSVYEYKIEGTKVMYRQIESKTEHAGSGEYYDIKDGVVLESEVIKRIKGDKFSHKSAEEEIKELKEKLEWSELGDTRVRAYVLSQNLSEEDFRRYARGEIERLKVGKLKLEELCEEFGVKLAYNDEDENNKYWEIKGEAIKKDDWPEKKWRTKFEKLLKSCNCSYGEIQYIDDLVEELELFMKSKKK